MTVKLRVVMAVLSVLTVLILTSCLDRNTNAPSLYVRPLEIVKLSDNHYMHISYLKDGKGGHYPYNGYIFIDNGEALIFDTPINDILSEQLIDFVNNKLKVKLKGLIINHSHNDACGGIKLFQKNDIATYASQRTAALLTKDSLYISNPFDTIQQVQVGNTMIENRYLGEAHTSDNIVSYIPSAKTIIGGCMIKGLDESKGNIKNANLTTWSSTVTAIKETYPETELVFPGHGGYGDSSLLDYTIALFSSPTNK